MLRSLTLFVTVLAFNPAAQGQIRGKGGEKADTLLLFQLLQEARSSMGSAHFHTVVDSLGLVAKALSTSTDERARKLGEYGLIMHQVRAGWGANFKQRFADAIRHANAADVMLGERMDSLAVIARLANVGMRMSIHEVLGDTIQWRAMHAETIRLGLLNGDTLNVLNRYGLTNSMGATKASLIAAERFIQQCIDHGSDRVATSAHWQMGRLLRTAGRYEEALAQVKASRAFAMDGSTNAWMPPFYHSTMGWCHQSLDRPHEALVEYDSCMQVAARGGLPDWYCGCASSKSDMLRLLGRRREAMLVLQAALDTAKARGTLRTIATAAGGLSSMYRDQQDWEAALGMSDIYHTYTDSLDNPDEGRALAAALLHGEMRADSLAHVAEIAVQGAEVKRQRLLRNGALGGSALLGLCAVIFLFQRVRISKEKKRSDELLLNILPAEVAKELKDTGSAAARHIEHATILFTDFKGFTEAGEVLTPQELVEELHTCFKAFDAIITARGIEKIKTIGDAYMAAGGLQRLSPSGVAAVVHAALEMQEFMVSRKTERTAQGKPAFEMRVGIHTGPVVAGIVGVKKFQYDIWGDTVNTASRMESSGEVGRVNISEATYREIVGQRGLTFTPRGKVSAKGKGELEMYFVHRSTEGAKENFAERN